jgi:hypothetical protein
VPVVEREIKKIEFEANRAHRKKELDVLIQYLSASGKTVDRTEFADDPEQDVLPTGSLHYVSTELGGCNLKNVLIDDSIIKIDTSFFNVSKDFVEFFVGFNYTCKIDPFETKTEMIDDVLYMYIVDTCNDSDGYQRCICYYTFDFLFSRQGAFYQKYKIVLIDPRKKDHIVISEGITSVKE